jgi:hypothetical protein
MAATIKAEQVAGWAVELSKIEDRIGEVQAQLRLDLAERRKEIRFLQERSKALLGLISGREHEQLPLLDDMEPEEPNPLALPAGWRWVDLGVRSTHSWHVASSMSAGKKRRTVCGELLLPKPKDPHLVWAAEGQTPPRDDADHVCLECGDPNTIASLEVDEEPAPAKKKAGICAKGKHRIVESPNDDGSASKFCGTCGLVFGRRLPPGAEASTP